MNKIPFQLFLTLFLVNNYFLQINCKEFFDNQDNSEQDSFLEEECHKSFFETLQELHEESRAHNNSVRDFDINFITHNVLKKIFQFNKRNKLKYAEFANKIDLGLSRRCSHAFILIYQALKRSELWAIKCKQAISINHMLIHSK